MKESSIIHFNIILTENRNFKKHFNFCFVLLYSLSKLYITVQNIKMHNIDFDIKTFLYIHIYIYTCVSKYISRILIIMKT